jgi:membrane protease subunit HflC
VQGNEDAARSRLSQTVRSNLAEEFNKSTMHEAISTGRDRITNETRLKADQDAKLIGVEVVDVRLRRLALPSDVTGPVYARMESERRVPTSCARSVGGVGRSAPTPTASQVIRRRYRSAKDQGREHARPSAIYATATWAEPRVLGLLSQPRGVQADVPRRERPHGARPGRALPVLQEFRRGRARGAPRSRQALAA